MSSLMRAVKIKERHEDTSLNIYVFVWEFWKYLFSTHHCTPNHKGLAIRSIRNRKPRDRSVGRFPTGSMRWHLHVPPPPSCLRSCPLRTSPPNRFQTSQRGHFPGTVSQRTCPHGQIFHVFPWDDFVVEQGLCVHLPFSHHLLPLLVVFHLLVWEEFGTGVWSHLCWSGRWWRGWCWSRKCFPHYKQLKQREENNLRTLDYVKLRMGFKRLSVKNGLFLAKTNLLYDFQKTWNIGNRHSDFQPDLKGKSNYFTCWQFKWDCTHSYKLRLCCDIWSFLAERVTHV